MFCGDWSPAVFKYFMDSNAARGTIINKLRWVASFARMPRYGLEKYQSGMRRSADPLCNYDVEEAKTEAIQQLKEDLQDLIDDNCFDEDEIKRYTDEHNEAIREIEGIYPDSDWDKARALTDVFSAYSSVNGDWESHFGQIVPHQVLVYAVAAEMIVAQYDAIYGESGTQAMRG